MPSNGRVDLTLLGISDTDLLAIVDDLANDDGWTLTADIRLQLGESLDVKRSGVGSRLAWMRRYGWLEQSHERRDLHRLTAAGEALLENPRLTKAIQNSLDTMNPAQRLALTRELAEHGTDIKTALRRQWTRSLR
jgi:hypothetical protein